jgi:hypothetical protein
LLIGVGAVLVAGTAHADPTDYIAVPIAKILKPKQFNLELVQTIEQWDAADEERATSFLTEFGITERLEAGIDFNSIDEDEVIEADVKYQFFSPNRNEWGLAAGAFDLFSDDVDSFFYVTATRNIGQASVTAGAGSNGDATAFFGASYPLTGNLTAIGEVFTDDSGFTLFGAAYKITDGFIVAAWYQNFNESPVEQLQVDLIVQSEF